MTSEHDRLLAEGPRTAPEPLTAPDLDGTASTAAPSFESPAEAPPAPSVPSPLGPQPARPTGTGGGSRSRPRSRRGLLRFLVPAVVAAVVVARAAFDRHGAGTAAFAVVWVVVLALGIGLRRRRW
jgi:hypothetical protein